ncbi:MAG: hypothetical protein JXB23_17325 [Candidatus Aminicenantes bacterium]|nr:hypothetical protein [Candidatus Aminicenantes bacterium]
MQRKTPMANLGIVVTLGAVWGLSEAALGMHLKQCASHVSGSLMTGIALFFIAASWFVSRRILGVMLLIFVASLMKMFDALLLGLPILHGAIANPIFAFITEGTAFLFIMIILRDQLSRKPAGQALSGGMAALLAANLFPLVKFATGIPACVVPGTGYPLSLYFIHYAILFSLMTVPAGFWLGAKIEEFAAASPESASNRRFDRLISPAALVLCLAIMALLRLV